MFVTARRVVTGAALAVLAGAGSSDVHAQSGTWTAGAGGRWGDAPNWQGNVIASGAGSTASFPLDLNTGASVTLDVDRTIGTVSTTSATPWSIDLGTPGGGLTVAAFTVGGSGVLTVTAPLNGADFTKAGVGTLALANPGSTYSAAININAGTLAVVGGGNYSTSPSTVHVATGAVLDITQLTSGLRYGGAPSTRLAVGAGETLDGTGLVKGGLKVNSGGTVYPGDAGVGAMSVQGNGNFDPLSNWRVKLSTANPGPANVGNRIDFSGSVQIADLTRMPVDGNGQTFAAGETYDYVIGTAPNYQLGAVSVQPTNFVPAAFAVPSAFSVFSSGNNLILRYSPVPEPWAVLIACSGAAGGWLQRARPGRRSPHSDGVES